MTYIVFFKQHKPFLDGIQSLLVSSKVHKYLDEVWALILQATAVDAAPLEFGANDSEDVHEHTFIAGRSMVKLETSDFQFLWGLSVLVLFHAHQSTVNTCVKMKLDCSKEKKFGDIVFHGLDNPRPCDKVLPVLLSLTTEVFFSKDFLSVDTCQELLQVSALCCVFYALKLANLHFSKKCYINLRDMIVFLKS
jgi:hypothetical protein